MCIKKTCTDCKDTRFQCCYNRSGIDSWIDPRCPMTSYLNYKCQACEWKNTASLMKDLSPEYQRLAWIGGISCAGIVLGVLWIASHY